MNMILHKLMNNDTIYWMGQKKSYKNKTLQTRYLTVRKFMIYLYTVRFKGMVLKSNVLGFYERRKIKY